MQRTQAGIIKIANKEWSVVKIRLRKCSSPNGVQAVGGVRRARWGWGEKKSICSKNGQLCTGITIYANEEGKIP